MYNFTRVVFSRENKKKTAKICTILNTSIKSRTFLSRLEQHFYSLRNFVDLQDHKLISGVRSFRRSLNFDARNRKPLAWEVKAGKPEMFCRAHLCLSCRHKYETNSWLKCSSCYPSFLPKLSRSFSKTFHGRTQLRLSTHFKGLLNHFEDARTRTTTYQKTVNGSTLRPNFDSSKPKKESENEQPEKTSLTFVNNHYNRCIYTARNAETAVQPTIDVDGWVIAQYPIQKKECLNVI